MKLQDNTATIERIGTITNETAFKMKASRKAYQILSDLYSDKPLAIVRELGCNAADSHVMANKSDVPFHIHVPNILEPWITIQDFGTGISHKDIFEIYATYFESTKTNSNTQIGCLGLGSKSPFSYTDNFTITSIVDGEKNIYNAYFNENNTPAIALMDTSNTTESNGVAIQIPVKQDDFYKFIYAIQSAFRFFKVKPTISGGAITWNNDTISFFGEGWESYESIEQGKAFCVMGGVTYPIDIYKLDNTYYDLIRHGGFVVYFEMGEVDFTPSRESLSYDEATVKALNDKFAFISTDFTARLSQTITDKENLYEALKAVYAIQTKFSFLTRLIKQNDYIWNGIDVSFPVQFINKATANMDVKRFYTGWGRRKLRYDSDISFKSAWYVDDVKRGGESRVKRLVRNTGNEVCFFTKVAYDTLIALGIPASVFIKTSTLPMLTRNKNSSGSVKTPTEFVIFRMGYSTWRDKWESESIDTATDTPPKFYIVRGESNRWDFSIKNDMLNYHISQKSSLENFLAAVGFTNNDICMVNKRNEAKMIAAGSISFQSWVDANIGNYKIVNGQDMLDNAEYVNMNYHYKRMQGHSKWNNISATHPFKKFILDMQACFKRVENNHKIASFLKVDETKHKVTVCDSGCPMTNLAMSRVGNWDDDDVLDVLIAMEKKNTEIKK